MKLKDKLRKMWPNLKMKIRKNERTKLTAGINDIGLCVIPEWSPSDEMGDFLTTIVVSECILASLDSVLGVPGSDDGSHASTKAAVSNGIPMLFNRSAKLPSEPKVNNPRKTTKKLTKAFATELYC